MRRKWAQRVGRPPHIALMGLPKVFLDGRIGLTFAARRVPPERRYSPRAENDGSLSQRSRRMLSLNSVRQFPRIALLLREK